MPSGDVIAAIATPPGRGALGVLRLSGMGSLETARTFLRLEAEPPARTALLAWAEDGASRLDRVLATYFPAGASYTGEETVEVSAHGSPFILERLLALSVRGGARLALPGEFTQRAYLNGKMDLAQAEAVCGLIAARTRLSHRAALNSLEGGLSRRAADLRGRLLGLRAGLEASLDHPDEDIPLIAPGLRSEASALARDVRELAGRGARLLGRSGPRVALLGRPNAGKSSLLNALLGRERAIVSETEGTTRDSIEEAVSLEGMEAVLIDTAGLSDDPASPIDAQSQLRARGALAGADLALLVVDRTRPLEHCRPLLDSLLADAAGASRPLLPVLNKVDASPERVSAQQLSRAAGGAPVAQVSALQGRGIGELARLMRGALEAGSADEQALEISARNAGALEECARELEAGASEPALELAASRFAAALGALDRVVGPGAPDELLAEIFSRFCVGK